MKTKQDIIAILNQLVNRFSWDASLKDRRELIEDSTTRMFKGIDKNDCDDNDGWWKTSTGAEFGKGKIEELKQFIDSLYSEGVSEIACPFCGDGGFDLIGLKYHLITHCKEYANIENIQIMLNDQNSRELASRLHGDADIQHQSIMNRLIESEEYNLVALLKPEIFIDGDMWCVLWGKDLQSGVAGFGKSPILAIYDFNKSWEKELHTSESKVQILHMP